MSADAPAIKAAFLAACRAELQALKPGNVHIHAPGHRMSVADFEASAKAAAPFIAARGASVGERIEGAVAATWAAVGQNTNLGIVLLCAPLAAAAEDCGRHLRDSLRGVLAGLTVADASHAFRAIALANPGGLGGAGEADVRAPAAVTLLRAMRLAAPRDCIARQYASVYEDVLGLGAAALMHAASRFGDESAAAAAVYLAFLSAFPDTHIERKFGAAIAEAVRLEAAPHSAALGRARGLDALKQGLMAFDASLKARGLNPGTSADLTVATLFAARLVNPFKTPG